MTDYCNKEVLIGDTVVFNEPHYKGLVSGEIIRFTPKGVRIKYYLHDNPARYQRDTFVYEGQFVKVEVYND